MTYEIHDGNSDDFFRISAETIEELRAQAEAEAGKRGWRDCWSKEAP